MSYLCTRCLDTYPEPGTCKTHAEEDLIDVRDEEVVRYLSDLDYRARMRNMSRWSIALALVGALLAFVLGAGILTIFAIAIAGGSIGLAVSRIQFQPKFTRWTGALDE